MSQSIQQIRKKLAQLTHDYLQHLAAEIRAEVSAAPPSEESYTSIAQLTQFTELQKGSRSHFYFENIEDNNEDSEKPPRLAKHILKRMAYEQMQQVLIEKVELVVKNCEDCPAPFEQKETAYPGRFFEQKRTDYSALFEKDKAGEELIARFTKAYRIQDLVTKFKLVAQLSQLISTDKATSDQETSTSLKNYAHFLKHHRGCITKHRHKWADFYNKVSQCFFPLGLLRGCASYITRGTWDFRLSHGGAMKKRAATLLKGIKTKSLSIELTAVFKAGKT